MKLWFDEDLSPSLVQVAIECGFEATCNRDRDMLGSKDHELRHVVQAEDFVFVTDNVTDFRPMYARDDLHPGLIVVPGTVRRVRAAEAPADFMVNRLVAIDEHGHCSLRDLPPV